MRHLPTFPTWDCQACGEPWLCDQGTAELREVFGSQLDAPELRNFLDHFFRQAAGDFQAHGLPNLVDLRDRVFGWLPTAAMERAASPRSMLVNDPHWPDNRTRALNRRQP